MLFLTEVVDYCKYKPAALLYLTVAKPNRSTLGHNKGGGLFPAKSPRSRRPYKAISLDCVQAMIEMRAGALVCFIASAS